MAAGCVQERPVPDFEWTAEAGAIGNDLWNSSAHVDSRWAEVVANISAVYLAVGETVI